MTVKENKEECRIGVDKRKRRDEKVVGITEIMRRCGIKKKQ